MRQLNVGILLIFFIILIADSSGKNILFFFGICNFSHRMSAWPLVEALANKGHNVTSFSSHLPKSLKHPKVHEVVPQTLLDFNERWKFGNLITNRLESETGYRKIYDTFPDYTLEAIELLLEDKDFMNWFHSSHFDFIFMDAFNSEFALALAHKHKAQYAIFSTTSPYMWQSDIMGSPVESSWLPDMQIHFPDGNDMTFFQRVRNTLAPIWWDFRRKWDIYPRLEKLLKEDYGLKDFPGIVHMEKDVSLVLMNSHFSEEYGRSLPPLVVPVGGMHCNYFKNQPVPKGLEKFLNDSGTKGGFMFMTMGSGAQVSNMPEEMQKIFFRAFEKAKISIVLQWKDAIPKDMPKNVFPYAWLPQQYILSHPNIKGFITHGGLLSMHEAICSGVPLIVFPLYAEQDYNGNRVHKRKLGIKLEIRGITQEELDNAISSILNDPVYKTNMVKTSKLFYDRIQTPLETAVWWTEYVLRNGQVEELKPLGIYQTWWQRRGLDVWLAIFTALASIPFSIVCIIAILCLKRQSNKKLQQQKQSKGKKAKAH